jgi:hypothetical protein
LLVNGQPNEKMMNQFRKLSVVASEIADKIRDGNDEPFTAPIVDFDPYL